MKSDVLIRSATRQDADSLLEIYRPYVEDSAISFELEVPALAAFQDRIVAAVDKWAWLVAEVNGTPVGYAYGSAHRPRAAYHYSVETSAYVSEAFQKKGIARSLYRQLIDVLIEKGYCSAYAGVALPNDASIGFHLSMGFEHIGVFPRVGRKFGRWHDVAWLYRPLASTSTNEHQ